MVFPALAQQILDLIGIFVFAISGALTAIRKDLDLVGILLLAEVAALGGGVLRDVLVGRIPPVALTNLGYYLVPAVAAGVAFVAHPAAGRLNGLILAFDAAGLGLFCVSGTLVALNHGLGVIPSAGVGVLTGVGGGVLRDMLVREIPLLLRRDSEMYAIPAFIGVLLLTISVHFRIAVPYLAPLTVVFIVVFRLLALRFHWHAPRARQRRGQN